MWVVWRRYRTGLFLIALGGLWVIACATPIFASLLLRGLESQYPSQPAAAYPSADAIVVLGGAGLPPLGAANNAEQLASTRLGFALLLYQNKRATQIVVTGGGGSAIAMKRRLLEFGVPAAAIRAETRSMTTYQDALLSSAILKKEGLSRVLLVTSPDHMPRSVASFNEQGLDVIPAPSNERHPKLDNSEPWRPQHDVLLISSRILHEYIGFYAYKFRGWA